jgi:hypothetical protein
MAERLLLMQELKQLETLLKATPKNAPERAVLLKRIADTYAELAKRAAYEEEVARRKAEQARELEKLDRKTNRRPRTPVRM